jgi:serine protease Do
VGEEVKITVLRGGKKEEMLARIGNLEDATKFLAVAVKERLGVEVRPLNSREVEKYGLKGTEGVAINWLAAKGPLQRAGFEIGDLILGIDDQPVQGMDSFVQLVSALKPKQEVSIVAVDHRTGNQGMIQVVVR